MDDMRYDQWQKRRASASFREPILRFGDVVAMGLVGGVALFLAGSPGGILHYATMSLWNAAPSDSATVSSGLAQTTLTVWAVFTSIGGAVYVEAARTIRTDSRRRAEVLNEGLRFVKSGRFSKRLPADLQGKLLTIAQDSPPFSRRVSRRPDALSVVAEEYGALLDYWNFRAGYSTVLYSSWTPAEEVRMRRILRIVRIARSTSLLLVVWAVAAAILLGPQAPLVPLLLGGAVILWVHGRHTLLGRTRVDVSE
jgi:hypothetical protein